MFDILITDATVLLPHAAGVARHQTVGVAEGRIALLRAADSDTDAALEAADALGGFGGGVSAEVWGLLPVALLAHGAGVLLGSFNAHRINAPLLKGIVAVGSIAVAAIKLIQLAL